MRTVNRWGLGASLVALLAGCGPLFSSTQAEFTQRNTFGDPVMRGFDLRGEHPDQALLARWLRVKVRHLSEGERREVARLILDAAAEFELDPLLIASVILVESHYRSQVVSSAGAVGLMQVLPWVGEDVARRNGLPWDGPQTLRVAEANIRIGTAFLVELIARFGDTGLALAAYNMGPTLLQARLNTGWVPNGPYVRKVRQTWRILHEQRVFDHDLGRRTLLARAG